MQMDVHKTLYRFYTTKKMPHESTRSIRIYFEIFFKWNCIRVCHKSVLSVIRYSVAELVHKSRYHCELHHGRRKGAFCEHFLQISNKTWLRSLRLRRSPRTLTSLRLLSDLSNLSGLSGLSDLSDLSDRSYLSNLSDLVLAILAILAILVVFTGGHVVLYCVKRNLHKRSLSSSIRHIGHYLTL